MTDTLTPSLYQQAVYDFIQHGHGSAVVIAVAGSGKTTTILEALSLIPNHQSAQLFAFNTAIAAELKKRIPSHRRLISAATFHSVGYRALCAHFNMRGLETNGRKLNQLVREKIKLFEERKRYEAFICKLVDLAKGVGIGALVPDEPFVWKDLVDHHDLYVDDPEATEEEGIDWARKLLEWSNEAAENSFLIDFSDQLYLTVKWHLAVDRKDWVFVDEAQDTNPIRRALVGQVLKEGGRLIAVGDPKQSIYGFTGASIDAIDQIRQEWDCIELPLSVSYRCPKAIVKQAQLLVPYIEPAPYAAEGAVETISLREAIEKLGKDDVFLCRNNAPLVDLAYQLLKKGIGCQIQGRDIGKGLETLVTKMGADAIDDRTVGERVIPGLISRLDAYKKREMTRLLEKEQHGKAQSVDDRVQCLLSVVDNLPETDRSLQGLTNALGRLFGDETEGRLTLSTVHKAKGKEWPQVAILRPELMPAHWAQSDWEQEQEDHVQYVAWTRARAALFFIRSE
jgi:DNA helicase-2/ATP-dependent DNA helicase PcrA